MTTGPLVPQPDTDPRGLKGLPPFVDVVYGAALGFGVIKIEEGVRAARTPGEGNQTALFLSIVTTLYLVFDYANTRMCVEKYPYRTLTRYTLDIFSAIAFVFAYVAADSKTPYYLLWLAILLILGAFWIVSLEKEYLDFSLPRLVTYAHVFAAIVLPLLLLLELSGNLFVHRWILRGGGGLFLPYSIVLSVCVYFTDLSKLERGLLPIIPFYALFDVLRGRR